MRLALPLLLVAALAACSEPTTSPAAAPAAPSDYRVIGDANLGFPPPPPLALQGSFTVSSTVGTAAAPATASTFSTSNYPVPPSHGNPYAGQTSTPIAVQFLFNKEPTAGSITFDARQPAGSYVTPGAAVIFRTDGTLTGRGLLAVSLNGRADVAGIVARSTFGSSGYPGGGEGGSPTAAAAVIIDLAHALDDRRTVVIPSCTAPYGPDTCATIPVLAALLVDARGHTLRIVSGTIDIDAPPRSPTHGY